mmetsp:Transcript_3154/g.11356  ORF Transcript_3154/g.11356 Transcript_3154/m.11356 type:complete len:219 (-) Transcript_3154:3410-4066(-)
MPGVLSSSCGLANCATRPSSSTSTRSESAIVRSLCAMASTVVLANAWRTVVCSKASVASSTLAVLSSITSTRGCRSSERAMHISCRSPTDKLDPPADTSDSSPLPSARTRASTLTSLSAVHSSSSVNSRKGSRLLRTVPANSVGSCGRNSTARRSESRPISAMLTPSMRMLPLAASHMRSSEEDSDDLPAPVRPTIPIFSPALIVKLMSFTTSGSPGR